MAEQLTKDQKEFVERTKKHRQEKIEDLAYLSLAKFLKDNINFFDVHYVVARAKEVLIAAHRSLDFKNPKIEKARREFMKVMLGEMKKKREWLKPKESPDETDVRNERCEASAQHVADLLMEEELLFSDKEYISDAIKNDDQLLLATAIDGYLGALYEKLLMVLSTHEREAYKKFWGVEREKISFEMLDEVLKRE